MLTRLEIHRSKGLLFTITTFGEQVIFEAIYGNRSMRFPPEKTIERALEVILNWAEQ